MFMSGDESLLIGEPNSAKPEFTEVKRMRKTVSKWCNIASLVLIACFVIKTVLDYNKYSSTLNSAPFSLWMLVNAVYFVLPALIVFIIGIVLKKKR